MPAVDLALCPIDRPSTRACVSELGDDVPGRGIGFWCTTFVAGKGAGEADCFRFHEPCESWRRKFRKVNTMSACSQAERASCIKGIHPEQLYYFYRCFPTAVCETIRANLVARRRDLVFTECRETD